MDNWIKIEDRMPEAGRPVDIFVNGRRLCNYRLILNCNFTPGNDFFEPMDGGRACVRARKSDDDSSICATHWMYPPPPPPNDHQGEAGLLSEAQFKAIADRILEEHRKYGDRFGPVWAEVAARKVAKQMVEFSVGERVFTESEVMAFIAALKLEYGFHSASEVVDRVARRFRFLDHVHAHQPKEEQQKQKQ